MIWCIYTINVNLLISEEAGVLKNTLECVSWFFCQCCWPALWQREEGRRSLGATQCPFHPLSVCRCPGELCARWLSYESEIIITYMYTQGKEPWRFKESMSLICLMGSVHPHMMRFCTFFADRRTLPNRTWWVCCCFYCLDSACPPLQGIEKKRKEIITSNQIAICNQLYHSLKIPQEWFILLFTTICLAYSPWRPQHHATYNKNS